MELGRSETEEGKVFRLEWIRKHLGLKKYEFAAILGVQPNHYTNWLRFDSKIPDYVAVELAKEYDVPMDFLYLGRTATLPAHFVNAWASRPREQNSSKSSE